MPRESINENNISFYKMSLAWLIEKKHNISITKYTKAMHKHTLTIYY